MIKNKFFSRINLKTLFNIMAEFLSIISKDGFSSAEFDLFPIYNELKSHYTSLLNASFEKGTAGFLKDLKALLNMTKDQENERRSCIAHVICLWLDQHISFESVSDDKISLISIVNINQKQAQVINSLNTNYRKTKIWINPKFAIHKSKNEFSGDERNGVTNKSSWVGINSALDNVAYFDWDGTVKIKNIIISETDLHDASKKSLSIAFVPMTCETDLIEKTFVKYRLNNHDFKGAELKLKRSFPQCSQRLESDWSSAVKFGADIILMPEMLGTAELCGKGKEIIDFIREASIKLDARGQKLPLITILPSFWHLRSNSSTIVSGDGKVLGIQEKHVPYVKRSEGWIEALDEEKPKEFIIIHIPHVHRISVVICSEYLEDTTVKWSDILCRSLGVSLLLVPSYSEGEQAFLKTLARYRETGGSVVWGNACGAKGDEVFAIGGCSIAELNVEKTFGEYCQCGFNCDGVKSCVFLISLDLTMTLPKIKSHDNEYSIKHIINNKIKEA